MTPTSPGTNRADSPLQHALDGDAFHAARMQAMRPGRGSQRLTRRPHAGNRRFDRGMGNSTFRPTAANGGIAQSRRRTEKRRRALPNQCESCTFR